MYLIKRYRDRRLYDTIKKKYLNLRKIIALVKAGKEIKVVDKNSGEDITQKVLKKTLLQSGSISSLVKESFCAGLDALLNREQKVGAFLSNLVKEGHLPLQEAKRLKNELLQYIKERKSKIKAVLFPKRGFSPSKS